MGVENREHYLRQYGLNKTPGLTKQATAEAIRESSVG